MSNWAKCSVTQWHKSSCPLSVTTEITDFHMAVEVDQSERRISLSGGSVWVVDQSERQISLSDGSVWATDQSERWISLSDGSVWAADQSEQQISLIIVDVLSLNWLVAWHSGRTLVFDRRTFPALRSTCSWWMTTYVGKLSAVGHPTRPTQPFILSG